MAQTSTTALPKAPPAPPAATPVTAPVMTTADVARGFELLAHYMTFDGRAHPDDITEMRAILARVRASTNNQ
jgi:hypothetical protein